MVLRQGLELQIPRSSVGSPSTLPAVTSFIIQAGSLVTSAGSVGFTAFGTPMQSTDYYVQLTIDNLVLTSVTAGSYLPYISGARSTSGVNIIGGAATRYNYVAIG